jgi:hypothetical protein
MKKVIAVVIFAAVLAAGFFGLMVPRHVLNVPFEHLSTRHGQVFLF